MSNGLTEKLFGTEPLNECGPAATTGSKTAVLENDEASDPGCGCATRAPRGNRTCRGGEGSRVRGDLQGMLSISSLGPTSSGVPSLDC